MARVLSILVTGGAGFIGSHLVDRLVQLGHRVRVLDNLEEQVHGDLCRDGAWPEYANRDAEYILGDVRDQSRLPGLLAETDVLFHLAAVVGVGQSMYEIERYVDSNSRGTSILLDVLARDPAARERLQKFVVASSMSIYGEGAYTCPRHGRVAPGLRNSAQLRRRDWEPRCTERVLGVSTVCGETLSPMPTAEDNLQLPTSVYAVTKRDQEDLCLLFGRAYNVPTVALRYFNVYGPRQALSNPYTGMAAIFASRYLSGRPPVVFEDGRQTRDLVHVSDIVQANLIALDQPSADFGSFNVGTGRAVTVCEVARLLASQLRVDIAMEVPGEFRTGDIRHCYADVSLIESVGYRSAVRLEDGLDELTEWLQHQRPSDGFVAAHDELKRHGLTY